MCFLFSCVCVCVFVCLLAFGKSIPSRALCTFYWRVFYVHHLMEKLCWIFVNHSWEESLLPWGHITGVRKKSSRITATSKVPHTAFSYGVHITKTTEQSFTVMFLIIFFFYFILWFSCSFYFCDITFSFCFTLKAQGRKRSRPDLPEMLGKIFQIKTGVCNLFSVQFLTMKHNTLPSSQILCHISLDCAPPSTTSSNSITNQMMC